MIFESILIIFIPHLVRLFLIPGYAGILSENFQDPNNYIVHGLIPTLCAAITFGISSIVFIGNASTLFRPILKSASKYVGILEQRQTKIPTLGCLESLGFTNAMVMDTQAIKPKKSSIYQIIIGSKTPRNSVRSYGKKEIQKFETIFSHRVLRPFNTIYSESEVGTWLSFARMIMALSLQNDEIFQILKNSMSTKNIYCKDYIKPDT